jgi:hypothetical protein
MGFSIPPGGTSGEYLHHQINAENAVGMANHCANNFRAGIEDVKGEHVTL